MTLSIRPLTAEEIRHVQRIAADATTPPRLVQRAAIVALAQRGVPLPSIAHTVGVSEYTVRVWLQRFERYGLAGLTDLVPR
jgi:predicted transcriptional regulator